MFPCPCILGAWIRVSVSPYFSFFLPPTVFTSQSGTSSLMYNFQCFQMFPSQILHSDCSAISATCSWEPYSVSLPNRNQSRVEVLYHWPNQRHYHDCRLVWPILWLALSANLSTPLCLEQKNPLQSHSSFPEALQSEENPESAWLLSTTTSRGTVLYLLMQGASAIAPSPLHVRRLCGSVQSTSNSSLCPHFSKDLNSSHGRDKEVSCCQSSPTLKPNAYSYALFPAILQVFDASYSYLLPTLPF